MSKTLQALLDTRPWIAYIDDERNEGNSIIVTLSDGWFFTDEPNCGVRGFDGIAETRAGTQKNCVVQR